MTTKDKIRDLAVNLLQQKVLGPGAKVAAQRYEKFIEVIGPDWQCPRCWMEHAEQTNLRKLHSKTDEDIYMCSTCYLNV